MAPNLLGSSAIFLAEASQDTASKQFTTQPVAKPQTTEEPKYKWEIVWRNVLVFIYLHTASLYAVYLWLFVCQWKSFFLMVTLLYLASMGVTAGAHRLWAHKSYKAKLPMRIILMILNTMAFQNHVYEWARDHRVHHKFTDTDADPHNASRGFFFSHIGWLMVKKHPDVKTKGKCVDMTDLEEDWVVMFQKTFYAVLMPTIAFVLPTYAPIYFWGEDPWVAWYLCILRYTIQLNGTWLVNSAAHLYGTKPYDKSIGPVQNTFVAAIAFGEGWHNYHHVFPWDYKTDEFNEIAMNMTKAFIDMFAKIGWAYDLKTVSEEMIKKRALRTGDGTRIYNGELYGYSNNPDLAEHVWGWGDRDMDKEVIKDVKMFNKLQE